MSTAENPKEPAGRVADTSGETIARMIDSEPSGQPQASELRMLSPPHGPGELGWLGHYRIIKVLGEGGMGMVLMAEDTQLGRSVALKVIKPNLGQDLEIRQRFLREARAMALVKSDHVVTIYQVDQKNDTCYMAMELLEGEPLDRWLQQTPTPPLKETLRIGREIAQALAAAHARGLIHRDIKPANVWLEGETRRVKLLDFGLARPQHMDIKLTSTGMILGTPAYMAPEQANGGDVDQRADLFSLGCMLYEMVSGRLPFHGDTTLAVLMAVVQKTPLPPRKHHANLPEPVNDLILRMLAKDPADRPESAQAVIGQLQAIENALALSGAGAAGAVQQVPAVAGGIGNPLEQPTRMVVVGDTPAAGLKGGTWAKVLLVEPSRTQAAIMRSYLQNQGIQDIVAVVSGQEALQAVRSRCPDAIIGSLHLPDMTGVQLAQQIHSEFMAASPGFVLITSASEAPDVDTLGKGGRSIYLHKPFTPEQLVESLRRVMPVAAATTARGQQRVLIVDDSASARLHVRSVLGGLGLTQFVEAADGARAIAAVAGGTFQLIVTDYHMPHLDGRGLVGYLKENTATAAVPIIMVTTETDPAKLEAVRQLGVTVCDKSFRPEIVREILDQLLGEIMNEVIREFLIETHENLAQLDLDLVTLEKDPKERETLGRAFRTLHTIKGTAGFLGLQKLQAVAHAAENLLSQMRDGQLIFDVEIASALLAGVDAIRQMLEAVEADETDGEAEFSAVIATLERLCSARAGAPPPASVAVLERPAAPASIVARASLPPQPSISLLAPESSAEGVESRVTAVSDSSIRVDVGLLDKLMTLVGELVLARNQIVQFGTSQEDAAFTGTVQRLNLLTSELQAGVMKTRMQPIGNLWSKFPRAVRDLAVACNKQARLDMDGQETELDKTIIEALRDPLTHLVRNAIDHGIESPSERLARGKPAEGRLSLHAFHEGGKVIIEISDDGSGIDPQKVRAKAIRAKLLDAAQADSLNERELVDLVFLPGFSTAEQVSQFSGRGVGMDVVRTNVEKIGGTVNIDSSPGQGTTVRMKIPLTLAIIPALTISSGGNRYAIPQVNLLELVCLEGERAQRALEFIHGAPVYRLRGNLLPLVYLDRQLGAEPSLRELVNMVVLQADDRQFGLIVDAIHDTEEIVVKPLSPMLKGIGLFAGTTIMGDGKVALILDVLGLAQQANVVSGARERSLSEKRGNAVEAAQERQALLLFAAGAGGRMAIPLSLVTRLEVFPRSALEKAGPHDVIQYRGEIMPLLHVSRVLERLESGHRKTRGARTSTFDDSAAVEVVVYAAKGRHVGLVVDRIIDIVEQALPSRSPAQRPGVLFTAVVQGRATEVLNVEEIFGWIDRDFLAQPQTSAVEV